MVGRLWAAVAMRALGASIRPLGRALSVAGWPGWGGSAVRMGIAVGCASSVTRLTRLTARGACVCVCVCVRPPLGPTYALRCAIRP
jgi:hypothetical protein